MNRSKYHEKIQNCSFTCKNLDRFYKSLPKNLTIARIEVQLATKITLFQLLCRKRHLARIKEFQKRKIREKIETSEKRLESIKKLRHRLRSLFCNTKWTALNLKNYFSQQGLKCLQNITISNAVILSTVFTSPRIHSCLKRRHGRSSSGCEIKWWIKFHICDFHNDLPGSSKLFFSISSRPSYSEINKNLKNILCKFNLTIRSWSCSGLAKCHDVLL